MGLFCVFFALILAIAQSSCDNAVVIVGGGMAGLAAATEALEHGAERVILVDKEVRIGGNSAKATSGMNGAGSEPQKDQNVEDSVKGFAYDTMVSGALGDKTKVTYGEANILAQTLAENSAAAVGFLQSKGADVTNLVQCGGHSSKRTHRPQGGRPAGWTFVKAVKDGLEGKVDYQLSTRVTEILVENNAVQGLRYVDGDGNEGVLETTTLILATGGYANDHTETSLLAEFRPDLIDIPTTNGPWATGDGVKLGRSINAKMVDMEAVQVHPTGFVDPKDRDASTKFLAPEAIRGSGAILINSQGERFVNELDLRSTVVAAERKQMGSLYLVLNPEAKQNFGPAFGFYQYRKGFAQDYDSYVELAEQLNVDPEVMKNTLVEYIASQKKGEDQYGKTVFPATFSLEDKLTLTEITPVIHYTMGGLATNEKSQILNKNGKPITGLFGAGEVTGGVHGKNRLAGNSLLECVVFGRIAGTNAAHRVCGGAKSEL